MVKDTVEIGTCLGCGEWSYCDHDGLCEGCNTTDTELDWEDEFEDLDECECD